MGVLPLHHYPLFVLVICHRANRYTKESNQSYDTTKHDPMRICNFTLLFADVLAPTSTHHLWESVFICGALQNTHLQQCHFLYVVAVRVELTRGVLNIHFASKSATTVLYSSSNHKYDNRAIPVVLHFKRFFLVGVSKLALAVSSPLKIIPFWWPPHWRVNVPPDSRPDLTLQAYRGLALYEVHQGTSQIREPNTKFETLDSRRNNAGSR